MTGPTQRDDKSSSLTCIKKIEAFPPSLDLSVQAPVHICVTYREEEALRQRENCTVRTLTAFPFASLYFLEYLYFPFTNRIYNHPSRLAKDI